jgi:hypothetical protein
VPPGPRREGGSAGHCLPTRGPSEPGRSVERLAACLQPHDPCASGPRSASKTVRPPRAVAKALLTGPTSADRTAPRTPSDGRSVRTRAAAVRVHPGAARTAQAPGPSGAPEPAIGAYTGPPCVSRTRPAVRTTTRPARPPTGPRPPPRGKNLTLRDDRGKPLGRGRIRPLSPNARSTETDDSSVRRTGRPAGPPTPCGRSPGVSGRADPRAVTRDRRAPRRARPPPGAGRPRPRPAAGTAGPWTRGCP